MKHVTQFTELFEQLTSSQAMLVSGRKEGVEDAVRSMASPIDEFICVLLLAITSISIVPVVVRIKKRKG